MEGRVSSAMSCPRMARMVSATMPVAAEADEKPSSLSGRSGKLRTKIFWNWDAVGTNISLLSMYEEVKVRLLLKSSSGLP